FGRAPWDKDNGGTKTVLSLEYRVLSNNAYDARRTTHNESDNGGQKVSFEQMIIDVKAAQKKALTSLELSFEIPVIIYGSYAQGKQDDDSDLDITVVFGDIPLENYNDRLRTARKFKDTLFKELAKRGYLVDFDHDFVIVESVKEFINQTRSRERLLGMTKAFLIKGDKVGSIDIDGILLQTQIDLFKDVIDLSGLKDNGGERKLSDISAKEIRDFTFGEQFLKEHLVRVYFYVKSIGQATGLRKSVLEQLLKATLVHDLSDIQYESLNDTWEAYRFNTELLKKYLGISNSPAKQKVKDYLFSLDKNKFSFNNEDVYSDAVSYILDSEKIFSSDREDRRKNFLLTVSHSEYALDTLKRKNISISSAQEFWIANHTHYFDSSDNLQKIAVESNMTIKELVLGLDILIISDIFENGNNYLRLKDKRNIEYQELSRTFEIMDKVIDGLKVRNIDMVKYVVNVLLKSRDQRFLETILDGRPNIDWNKLSQEIDSLDVPLIENDNGGTWLEDNFPELSDKLIFTISMEGNIPEFEGYDAQDANTRGGLGAYFGDKLEGLHLVGFKAIGAQPMYSKIVKHGRLTDVNYQELLDKGIIKRVYSKEGNPLTVNVRAWDTADINNHHNNPIVPVEVYTINRGGTPVFLFYDPYIFGTLYDDNRMFRYTQEVILGKAAYETLKVLEIIPDVLHLNEAHVVTTASQIRGDSYFKKTGILYTNHTVVPAGLEKFSDEKVGTNVERMLYQLGAPGEEAQKYRAHFLRRGDVDFCHAAAQLADVINGVSLEHGVVTKRLFQNMYGEDYDVVGVLNGSGNTWVNDDLLAIEKVRTPTIEELYNTHQQGKRVAYKEIEARTYRALDSDMPTLWEVRRIVEYKSQYPILKYLVHLLTADRGREFTKNDLRHFWYQDIPGLRSGFHHQISEEILNRLFADREKIYGLGMQIAVGGPKYEDFWADEFNRWTHTEEFKGRFTYIPNPDAKLLKMQAIGADICCNNPRDLDEACGTSDQRTGRNGGINIALRGAGPVEWIRDYDPQARIGSGFLYGPYTYQAENGLVADHDLFYRQTPVDIYSKAKLASDIFYDDLTHWKEIMHASYLDSAKVTASAMEQRYAPVYEMTIEARRKKIKGDNGGQEIDYSVLNGKTILFVEDLVFMHDLLSRFFIKMGIKAKLLSAYDGAQALTVIRSGENIDLVLTDIEMPKINGVALIKEIRETGNSVPIFVFSPYILLNYPGSKEIKPLINGVISEKSNFMGVINMLAENLKDTKDNGGTIQGVRIKEKGLSKDAHDALRMTHNELDNGGVDDYVLTVNSHEEIIPTLKIAAKKYGPVNILLFDFHADDVMLEQDDVWEGNWVTYGRESNLIDRVAHFAPEDEEGLRIPPQLPNLNRINGPTIVTVCFDYFSAIETKNMVVQMPHWKHPTAYHVGESDLENVIKAEIYDTLLFAIKGGIQLIAPAVLSRSSKYYSPKTRHYLANKAGKPYVDKVEKILTNELIYIFKSQDNGGVDDYVLTVNSHEEIIPTLKIAAKKYGPVNLFLFDYHSDDALLAQDNVWEGNWVTYGRKNNLIGRIAHFEPQDHEGQRIAPQAPDLRYMKGPTIATVCFDYFSAIHPVMWQWKGHLRCSSSDPYPSQTAYHVPDSKLESVIAKEIISVLSSAMKKGIQLIAPAVLSRSSMFDSPGTRHYLADEAGKSYVDKVEKILTNELIYI
ncbi:MAG: response regulator, partial [Parcubacteria group bacterium]|nr:response regulator [Parcubacteria group bacterium]